MDNAKKYFDRYSKLKRTDEALQTQIRETKESLAHLQSIESSLNFAESRRIWISSEEELAAYGYLKAKAAAKRTKCRKEPAAALCGRQRLSYLCGEKQLSERRLTFRFASGNDWWFPPRAFGLPRHRPLGKQGTPRRHPRDRGGCGGLLLQRPGQREGRRDYLQKKNVKKPNSAVPGFVIYHTNYSMTIHRPCPACVRQIKKITEHARLNRLPSHILSL